MFYRFTAMLVLCVSLAQATTLQEIIKDQRIGDICNVFHSYINDLRAEHQTIAEMLFILKNSNINAERYLSKKAHQAYMRRLDAQEDHIIQILECVDRFKDSYAHKDFYIECLKDSKIKASMAGMIVLHARAFKPELRLKLYTAYMKRPDSETTVIEGLLGALEGLDENARTEIYRGYLSRLDANSKIITDIMDLSKTFVDPSNRIWICRYYMKRADVNLAVCKNLLETTTDFKNGAEQMAFYKAYMQNPNADIEVCAGLLKKVDHFEDVWKVQVYMAYVAMPRADVGTVRQLFDFAETTFTQGRRSLLYKAYLENSNADEKLMLHVLQKAEDLTEKTTTFFAGYQIGVYTAYVRREDADPKLIHQLLIKVKKMDDLDRSEFYIDYLARPKFDQVVVQEILEDVACFENEFRKRNVYKAYMRNPNADPKILKLMIACLGRGDKYACDVFRDYIKRDTADVEVVEEIISVVEQFFCRDIEEFYRLYLSQHNCDTELMNKMLTKVREQFRAADQGCFYRYYIARSEADIIQVRLIFDDIKKIPHLSYKYDAYSQYLFSLHAEADVIQGKLDHLCLSLANEDGPAFYLAYLTTVCALKLQTGEVKTDAVLSVSEPVQVTDFVKSDAGLIALQTAIKGLAKEFAHDAMILWESIKSKSKNRSVKKAG